jgi:hypothetical protein
MFSAMKPTRTAIVLLSALLAFTQTAPKAGAQDNGTAPAASFEQPTDAETKSFLNSLVTDPDAMRPTGLFLRKDYLAAAALYRDGKNADALKAFGNYYISKLRDPLPYGINPVNLDPFLRGFDGASKWPSNVFDAGTPREAVLAGAEGLMHGKVGSGAKAFTIGEPGKVNWYAPYASAADVPPKMTPDTGLVTGMTFCPLVQAYLVTRDEKYLQRWNAYMWDWYRNCDYIDKLHPLLVPDGITSGVSNSVVLIRVLASLAQVQKQDGTPALDPNLLPLLLKKILLVDFPVGIAYSRSNCHNWTPSAAGIFMGLMLDEFKAAPIIFRQCLRRNVEDNAVTQNLRDGTENQEDPWYNENYFAVAQAINLLDFRASNLPYGDQYWVNPLRSDADWRKEIREHLDEHETYLIHLRTPQNEWPIPLRGGDKRPASRGVPEVATEAYDNAVNQSILKVIDDPDSGVVPPYDSEWFPYAGFNIVRSGWKPDSSCGALFCTPMPSAYGGYRGRSDNNDFGLSAYGQDLLIDDCTGHYMYVSSPLTVDGKDQFFHEKIYKVPDPESHKTYQVSAWTDPSPWRWHASDRFNLMEGIYSGAYGNPPPFVSADQTYGNQQAEQGAPAANDMIHGVTHQRLVFYDRHEGLWIVVDRMNSADSHTYDQKWFMPILPFGPGFDPKDITTDVAQKTIRTDKATYLTTSAAVKPSPKANLTLKQFSAGDLKYDQKLVTIPPRPASHDQAGAGWDRVDVTWSGQGPQQIVTAILPRAPGSGPEGDFQSISETKEDSAEGFTAKMPDGGTVQFVSAPEGKAELELGPVKITGQALLVSGDHGIALGCDKISIRGQDVKKPADDFEFSIGAQGMADTIPIYRPIAPVQIGPDSNVFTDDVDVTMTSATPGVEIRYTLDGTDPTPQSQLYTGPVKLTKSTRVKARAYRPGVTSNPVQLSGTEATTVSLAVFDRHPLTEPVAAVKDAPGLDVKYFEGDWKTLWFNLDEIPSSAEAKGVKLWDLSVVPASNPPIGSAPTPRQKYYAVQYSGFLNAPADGVYTFHAPHEFVYPDTESGCELKLEVGQRAYTYTPRKTIYGLQEWYPSTRLHAIGNWSVALKKGPQPFRLTFIDFRTDKAQKLNRPGINDYIWSGSTPDLQVSGPNLPLQSIPDAWFSYPLTTVVAR